MVKKRFWKGSLTWLRLGRFRFKWQVIRLRLFREFAILNHIKKFPEQYIKEGEYCLCGYHFTRELQKTGWNKWQSQDIMSFWHNIRFEKKWRQLKKREGE